MEGRVSWRWRIFRFEWKGKIRRVGGKEEVIIYIGGYRTEEPHGEGRRKRVERNRDSGYQEVHRPLCIRNQQTVNNKVFLSRTPP